MFSTGHLLWIGISFLMIAGGLVVCLKKKPSIDSMLQACLVVGVGSEFVKVLTVAKILPMVTPVVSGSSLEYVPTGQYTPFIEAAHLPLELCSLQIIFIAAALWAKSKKWKRRFLSIIFATGTLGGTLGIVLAYVTADYTTAASYFVSLRIWQFFIYHSMVVTLGLYVGISNKDPFNLKDFKGVVFALLSMDLLSFYLNSVFSTAVFEQEKPVGILYRVNFFSSYVNPLGLVLNEKWQWLLYLLIRLLLALSLMGLLFALQNRFCRRKRAR